MGQIILYNGQHVHLGNDIVTNNKVIQYHYPLDGNANELLNGADGVTTSITWIADRFGNPNKAAQFNGSPSKIVMPIPNEESYGKHISVSLWAYPQSSALRGDVLFALANPVKEAPWSSFTVYRYSGTSQFGVYIITESGITNTNKLDGTIPLNTWSHLALVYDAELPNQRVKFYINGVLRSTEDGYDEPILYRSDFEFTMSNLYNEYYYTGGIDDVRFYGNKSLTQTEITNLFNGNSVS